MGERGPRVCKNKGNPFPLRWAAEGALGSGTVEGEGRRRPVANGPISLPFAPGRSVLAWQSARPLPSPLGPESGAGQVPGDAPGAGRMAWRGPEPEPERSQQTPLGGR